jgi:CRISPR/Cas system-associated exonuclease Cas4 (RecB family)
MICTLPVANQTREERHGIFDYISPTRLNTWLSCPLKFKIRYVDGVREPTNSNLFLGRQVHNGLEFYYRGRQVGEKMPAAEVQRHIVASWDEAVDVEEMRFNSPEEEHAVRQQCLKLVETYLAQVDSNEGYPVSVESRVYCPLIDPESGDDLGISLLGYVDLILDGASGPVIVDFKTSARSSAPLDISHEIQLTCYAYAYRQLFGQAEQELQIRSLIKTKTPKVETHRYPARDDAHFRRLFTVMRAYLDDLHADRYVYRPGWTCSMCDYRETHCSDWQGW